MIVLGVGVVLVGGKLFPGLDHGPVPLEVHYLLPAGTTGLEVVVSPPAGGPAVASFDDRDPAVDVVSHPRLPGGDNMFAITLIDGAGARRTVTRTVEARRDAVVRIDLRGGSEPSPPPHRAEPVGAPPLRGGSEPSPPPHRAEPVGAPR